MLTFFFNYRPLFKKLLDYYWKMNQKNYQCKNKCEYDVLIFILKHNRIKLNITIMNLTNLEQLCLFLFETHFHYLK